MGLLGQREGHHVHVGHLQSLLYRAGDRLPLSLSRHHLCCSWILPLQFAQVPNKRLADGAAMVLDPPAPPNLLQQPLLPSQPHFSHPQAGSSTLSSNLSSSSCFCSSGSVLFMDSDKL